MALPRRCLVPLLCVLLAGPAAAEDLTMWADVDEENNYWMQPEAGDPAQDFAGRFCTAAGQNGTPCMSAGDPVVWELPLRLPRAVTLDAARQAVMRAFLSLQPCDPAGDAGCRPGVLAVATVRSALVRGNDTLLDGGARNVTLHGEPVEVVWLVPGSATVLDPAAGPVVWRVTLEPEAGVANAAFLGMSPGAWSTLTLPVLPPPAPVQAPPTVTQTFTDTRTVTASVTVTAVMTVGSHDTVTQRVSDSGEAGAPAAGIWALAAVLLAAVAVRRRLA